MRPTLVPGDRVIVDKTIMGARIYKDFDFNSEGGELKCLRTRGTRRIKHNDIVVFNYPQHNWHISFVINNVFCKRCIALPGDTIWSDNGYYKNNNYEGVLGVEEEQRKLSSIEESSLPGELACAFPYNGHLKQTIKNLLPVYVPRKGDVVAVTPYMAAYYRMYLEWETGKSLSWDWDKNIVYGDGKPLKRHTFQHNYYFMAGDNVMDSNDSRNWGLVPEEYIVGVVTHISYSKDRRTDELISDRICKDVTCEEDTENL
jgi:signal peptidase I